MHVLHNIKEKIASLLHSNVLQSLLDGLILKLKTAIRMFILRGVIPIKQRKELLFFSVYFPITIFLLLTTTIDVAIAVSWGSFAPITTFYVIDALRKIEAARTMPDFGQVLFRDLQHLKKDLNRAIPIIVSISATGLAIMVISTNQIPLPDFMVRIFGVTLETMTTIVFATLYWWFFLFLMEKYEPQKAATIAGLINLLPVIVGAVATVIVASYFGLSAILDFLAAFVAFVAVYYWVNRSIPDYIFPIPWSFKIEINKVSKEIEEVRKKAQEPMLKIRKTHLETELSKLRFRKKQLENALNWFQIGYEEIDTLQKDFVDFCRQMENIKETYQSRVGTMKRNDIRLLTGDEVIILKKVSNFNYQLQYCEKAPDKPIIDLAANILSLIIVARKFRKAHLYNVNDFKAINRNRAMIAVTETTTKDMPKECQEFDTMTLKEFFPAITRFAIDEAKLGMVLQNAKMIPCSFLWKKYEEIEENLLSSVNELKERIRERIKRYASLERDCPDCYIVKDFKSFLGFLGVSALEDFLENLGRFASRMSEREKRIQDLRNTIKLHVQLQAPD